MNGAREEQLALDYLCARGQKLVTRNFRAKTGELDLVMREGDMLVVVEVRKRSYSAFGGGAESVDARKQRRLAQTAQIFIATHPQLADSALRFDVVAFDADDRMEWIQNAFVVED